MIITAFLGYVLPWGQMSFWAAMVITNLLGSIPLLGVDLVFLVWGGFSLGNASLHRFYALHFFFPFVMLFISFLHVLFLHENGSNNPLGIMAREFSPFSPYYVLKDAYFVVVFCIVYLYVSFFTPDLLSHPDNFDMANFLTTPAHIVPEWYFLPLYAVLRSVIDKFMGIVVLFDFVSLFFFLPFYLTIILFRSGSFKPVNAFFFWSLLVNSLLLGWIGAMPVTAHYVGLGFDFTSYHFFLLLTMFPASIELKS